MLRAAALSVALLCTPALVAAQAAAPNDAQIAHIAYTAGLIDIAAGEQALKISKDPMIREFAQEMVRDHAAVNKQALALVKKLGVTPQDNPTSQALSKAADAKLKSMASLQGKAFDKAYIDNEVLFHKTVNSALQSTLIPDAKNAELKDLLKAGLSLFTQHQQHAEHVAASFS